MRWSVCALLCLSYVSAKHEEYDGHAVFSVKVQNDEHVKFINALSLPLDVWQYASLTREGVVLVPKNYVLHFRNELSSRGIEFTVKYENIKELLDLEEKLMVENTPDKDVKSLKQGPSLTFEKIYTLAEVDDYLKKVAEAYPDVVTFVTGGKSYEGRDINYLKISKNNFQDESKPIIFVETLLHAREWVTLPASLYAIDKLVVNNTEADLINDYDWIIMPVANPDGYEYSHTTDRLWRKSRRGGLIANDTCVGVDLNRNFDVFYGLGSSPFVCNELYHGTQPFSEAETTVIRDILHEYKGRIELFLDIHSFGSMILYGWGSGELPPNAFTLHQGGLRMAEAINAVKKYYNKDYVVGNVALVLYHASGLALDYGTVAGVPLSYAYEMPASRRYPAVGFLVDPEFIEQAGMETWEGIKTGARYARSVMIPRSLRQK